MWLYVSQFKIFDYMDAPVTPITQFNSTCYWETSAVKLVMQISESFISTVSAYVISNFESMMNGCVFELLDSFASLSD